MDGIWGKQFRRCNIKTITTDGVSRHLQRMEYEEALTIKKMKNKGFTTGSTYNKKIKKNMKRQGSTYNGRNIK